MEEGERSADGMAGVAVRLGDLLRVAVAGVLLVGGRQMSLGEEWPAAFLWLGVGYFAAAVVLAALRPMRLRRPGAWVTAAALLDVGALTGFMAVSGGFRSGLVPFLYLAVGGAALGVSRRLAAFYASLAALAMLGENLWRTWLGAGPSDAYLVGLSGAGAFAVALAAQALGERLRRAEESVRAQQQTLAWQREINDRILRELRDGVLVVDDRDVVRYASRPVRLWLGREPVGERVDAILPGVDRALARAGGERWVTVQGRRLRCRASVPYRGGGWLVFVSDLEEVSREFERNKLASLGALVGGVAHEVRNPLAAVVQALELMRGEEDATARETLRAMALDNAERIERLVEDVLSLGRRQRPRPEVLDLSVWLRQWRREALARLGRGEEEVVLEGEEGLRIRADPVHLRHILDNLLDNAAHFASRRAGAIRVCTRAEGERVRLEVCDDGPGPAPQVRERLFEPFVSSRAGGTGLGLYVARTLARANQGEVEWVDAGCFRVWLPREGP
ncbi:nitrogen regulation protein NR(II) [Tepidiphilus sp. J10]|uniref:two-component system sensor histidine kinase NtrB n=1 Tax=Tepidiphilus sp. J10 TaxID=2502185 RepID=UPI00115EDE2B|nr:HAMP domain-containing sensor histidine kinase [Tepidiphilus sp. J10]